MSIDGAVHDGWKGGYKKPPFQKPRKIRYFQWRRGETKKVGSITICGIYWFWRSRVPIETPIMVREFKRYGIGETETANYVKRMIPDFGAYYKYHTGVWPTDHAIWMRAWNMTYKYDYSKGKGQPIASRELATADPKLRPYLLITREAYKEDVPLSLGDCETIYDLV